MQLELLINTMIYHNEDFSNIRYGLKYLTVKFNINFRKYTQVLFNDYHQRCIFSINRLIFISDRNLSPC